MAKPKSKKRNSGTGAQERKPVRRDKPPVSFSDAKVLFFGRLLETCTNGAITTSRERSGFRCGSYVSDNNRLVCAYMAGAFLAWEEFYAMPDDTRERVRKLREDYAGASGVLFAEERGAFHARTAFHRAARDGIGAVASAMR